MDTATFSFNTTHEEPAGWPSENDNVTSSMPQDDSAGGRAALVDPEALAAIWAPPDGGMAPPDGGEGGPGGPGGPGGARRGNGRCFRALWWTT